MTGPQDISGENSGYDTLPRSRLIALLKKRDSERKLGLVWERDAIDTDTALDNNFVVADLVHDQCEASAPWDNLVIEGDNYDALRWLRMTHRSKIKCIYIDPPYNTGNKDWVYNDDYVDSNHRYRHSQWLEFLYQRLTIARDLLRTDGVMLISINDENRAKLELMADQALPGMRLGTFTWRSRTGGNDAKGAFLSTNHEHVLVYGTPDFRFGGTEKSFEKYEFWCEKRGDHFRLSDITQPKSIYERENAFYAMHDTNEDIYYPVNPQRAWPSPTPRGGKYKAEEFWQEDEMPVWPLPEQYYGKLETRDQIASWIKDEMIVFPAIQRVETWNSMEELLAAVDSGDVPRTKHALKLNRQTKHLDFWVGKKVGFGTPDWKRYKGDLKNATQPLSSWITPSQELDTTPAGDSIDPNSHLSSGMTQDGTDEIQAIFGTKAFSYAKPVSLLRELIRQSTGDEDTVLDFFAGSATTAQAVMELNSEDGGRRKYIMSSSTEVTSDQPDKNVCKDLTAKRLHLLNLNDEKYKNFNTNFAYLRCREIEPLLIDDEVTPEVAWSILEAHHGLPLSSWEGDSHYAIHESDDIILVLVDHWNADVEVKINSLLESSVPLFLYAFEPGQITNLDKGASVEIRNVRNTLRRLFAA